MTYHSNSEKKKTPQTVILYGLITPLTRNKLPSSKLSKESTIGQDFPVSIGKIN
jgi:hypothetical protein